MRYRKIIQVLIFVFIFIIINGHYSSNRQIVKKLWISPKYIQILCFFTKNNIKHSKANPLKPARSNISRIN